MHGHLPLQLQATRKICIDLLITGSSSAGNFIGDAPFNIFFQLSCHSFIETFNKARSLPPSNNRI
jgi:hypothetical protein